MALRYVTLADIRSATSFSTSQISDADLTSVCEFVEFEVEDFLNASFTPTTVIEQYKGDATERLRLNHNPVLKVRAINIYGTTVSPQYTRLDKDAGIIYLTTSAETAYFKTVKTEEFINRVKYDYGLLEATTTQISTTAANTTTGDTKDLTVSSSTGFAQNDYVEITGMDSQYEVAKVTAVPGATTITVDNLCTVHESGSLVTKLRVPKIAIRMMHLACAMAAITRYVGQSYSEIASYGIGDMSIVKGEAFTKWIQSHKLFSEEWNKCLESFRQRPAVM